ncbi:MAG: hypothetical protein WC632_06335 [Candidatus Margulisiibacteriota bacterium]
MTAEDEKTLISSLGINQVFEGIGNIINVVGKIVEEGGSTSLKSEADEKTPVCSHNSQ